MNPVPNLDITQPLSAYDKKNYAEWTKYMDQNPDPKAKNAFSRFKEAMDQYIELNKTGAKTTKDGLDKTELLARIVTSQTQLASALEKPAEQNAPKDADIKEASRYIARKLLVGYVQEKLTEAPKAPAQNPLAGVLPNGEIIIHKDKTTGKEWMDVKPGAPVPAAPKPAAIDPWSLPYVKPMLTDVANALFPKAPITAEPAKLPPSVNPAKPAQNDLPHEEWPPLAHPLDEPKPKPADPDLFKGILGDPIIALPATPKPPGNAPATVPDSPAKDPLFNKPAPAPKVGPLEKPLKWNSLTTQGPITQDTYLQTVSFVGPQDEKLTDHTRITRPSSNNDAIGEDLVREWQEEQFRKSLELPKLPPGPFGPVLPPPQLPPMQQGPQGPLLPPPLLPPPGFLTPPAVKGPQVAQVQALPTLPGKLLR